MPLFVSVATIRKPNAEGQMTMQNHIGIYVTPDVEAAVERARADVVERHPQGEVVLGDVVEVLPEAIDEAMKERLPS